MPYSQTTINIHQNHSPNGARTRLIVNFLFWWLFWWPFCVFLTAKALRILESSAINCLPLTTYTYVDTKIILLTAIEPELKLYSYLGSQLGGHLEF